MRRVTWMLAIVICLAVVVAGCGKKDAGSVVKDLEHVVGKLDSYQGEGRMVLHTGSQPQEYQVEVWYSNPHFYRISLTNEQKDITQIVLRNEEGVFVLTPHLKKSFRFQSDWPENQGQVYLYQSLAQSIIKDKERSFTTDNDAYVFDVLANYQNELLSRQKIWLNKKNLAPQHVEVSDSNQNVLVKVDFTSFEFGKKFEKDSFDMERNMTSWNLQTLPTLANVEGTIPSEVSKSGTDQSAGAGGADKQTAGNAAEGGQNGKASAQSGNGAATGKTNEASANTSGGSAAAGKQDAKQGASGKQQSFGIIEPSYLPQGVAQQDITEMKLGEDPALLLRYKGKYNYSLIEVRPQSKTVSFPTGDVVDLGYTVGVLTGEEKKTLTWTYDGVEFRLSTGDLPLGEMIKVAQAVVGQSGK